MAKIINLTTSFGSGKAWLQKGSRLDIIKRHVKIINEKKNRMNVQVVTIAFDWF